MLDNVQFASFSEFLQMGRYAFHVWSVYALFVIFILANLLVPRLRRRQFIREQRQRAQRNSQRGRTANSAPVTGDSQ